MSGVEPATAEENWERHRALTDLLSGFVGEWQGIPVSVPDLTLQLSEGHPLERFFREEEGVEMEIIVGGPPDDDDRGGGEVMVNHWFSRRRNADVYVYRDRKGPFAVTVPQAPDRSMDRLTFWLQTLGAQHAWRLEAEETAQAKLRGMVSGHQWRQYAFTGAFLERSPRSDLHYLFRRLRPTVVMSRRWPERETRPSPDSMRCLAVLCMHPVGYYRRTWAGCLTPTDDVIAALTLMRGDEADYWGQANQHDPAAPEAGL